MQYAAMIRAPIEQFKHKVNSRLSTCANAIQSRALARTLFKEEKMSVWIKDENHMPEMLNQLTQLSKYKVSAGIPENSEFGMIAAIMEYGGIVALRPEQTNTSSGALTPVTVPAFSYMRTTFEEKKSAWQERAEALIRKVMNGDLSAYQAYDQLGAVMAHDIQEKMKFSFTSINADLAIVDKLDNKTSVSLDKLRQAVSWKVEEI